MDEREVKELLTNAADGLVTSPDLSARAEHRYLRRRARTRVLSVAVAVAVVGSGVAIAAVASRKTTKTTAGREPASTSIPHGSSTTAPGTPAPIDLSAISVLSFVDANLGFAIVQENDTQTNLIRTDDGGRTWRRVAGQLVEPEASIHFENASDGVAWGNGPLEVTTDGGAHWTASDGPVDNELAWAGGRLWAFEPCVQSTPCGSRSVLISDDVGRTWRQTTPIHRGMGGEPLAAVSRTTLYVAEPTTDNQGGGARQLVVTHDGGASWSYRAMPCGDERSAIAVNDRQLLVACVRIQAGDSSVQDLWRSTDDGRTWNRSGQLVGRPIVFAGIGSNFVATLGNFSIGASTNGGATWQVALTADAPAVVDVLPGVGAWARVQSGVNSGLWFSADGMHWVQRTGPPAQLPSPVDPRNITAISFVNPAVGYGLYHSAVNALVYTDDGGRTWNGVAPFENPVNAGIHFENAKNGIAYRLNELEVTSDGGMHWTPLPALAFNKDLGWADGRIWVVCLPPSGCAGKVSFSDDVGKTWHPARSSVGHAPDLVATNILAVSQPAAYVTLFDPSANTWQLAVTGNGGRTWTTEATPCGHLYPYLAGNGPTLLLVCAEGRYATQQFDIYTSADGGRTWQPARTKASFGGYIDTVTSVGSSFVIAMGRGNIWASPDGKSWKRETDVAEGFWSLSTVPGVGVFAATGPAEQAAGILFSADGLHWEQRARV